MNERLLVVDDEPTTREALASLLRDVGFSTRVAAGPREALQALEEESIDLVLSDVKMLDPENGQMSARAGFELLQRLVRDYPGTPVVIITALHTVDTAVEAMRYGAANYITKPFRRIAIEKAVTDALANHTGARRTVAIPQPVRSIAPSMREVVDACVRAANSDATVLIVGPQGSGKEFTARAIHAASGRANEDFVPFAIRAIPENLLEAELLGSDRGAYTGATRLKRGAMEQAGRGTFFLDAIDEVSPASQAKLLMPLEKREFRRVGGNRSIPFVARVMAASSVNLLDRVRDGSFRNDLYYLLRVISIAIPPLRDRKEDIPQLARAFVAQLGREGRRNLAITDAAIDWLLGYNFPGNVRELRNILQSASAFAGDAKIDADDVRRAFGSATRMGAELPTIQDTKKSAERARIVEALARHPRNLVAAAKELNISRTTLWRKMKELGIPRGDEDDGSTDRPEQTSNEADI